MRDINPKNLIAVMLAGTVCLILTLSVIMSMFYPPGTVTETFRTKIFEMLTFIIGIVSGWLLGKGEPTPPPSGPKPLETPTDKKGEPPPA